MTVPGPEVPPGRGGQQRIPRPPTWRPGSPPPWHPGASVCSLDELTDRIARRGPGRAPTIDSGGNRPSAVLIGLFDGREGPEVVLTKRTWEMRSHAGEISFPGGRGDPGEVPVQTARREAHEEIGLHPHHVEVVGELDHLVTPVSRSFIVPVVGRLGARPELLANPTEVAMAFTVPLAEFLVDGVFREEHWGDDDVRRSIIFYELIGETVWGATARMLTQLLVLAVDQ